jgi:glycerophosphoryl diester phosphodiesterase
MLLNLVEKMLDASFAVIPRSKPSPDAVRATYLIAHRGAHDHTKNTIENTLPAFRLAEQLGCWGIELDIQMTADHVLVVNHDPTLKRLWGSNLVIAHVNFSDLRVQFPQIPTLAEVVDEFGQRIHLLIELKKVLNEDVLVQTLRGLRAGEDYHLLTLNESVFQTLSQFPKHGLLLVAFYNNINQFCDLSLKNHYAGVLGHYSLLTTRLVQHLKNQKQVVGVGFVDSKYSLYRELNRDINWIFTNRAVKVSSYLRSLLR